MNILKKYVKHVLLELKDFSFSHVPQYDKYIARLYNNGFVGYFENYGNIYEKRKDVNNPLIAYEVIKNSFVDFIIKREDLFKHVGLLLRNGFITIENKKTDYYETNFMKLFPEKYKKKEDVPKEMPYYKDGLKYSSEQNSIIVNHSKKEIDLDASRLQYMTRRPGKVHGGPTYVIPSGDVAFKANELDLQKLIKHVIAKDNRISGDYRIVGNEKYRNMTVNSFINKPKEVETALTGKTKIAQIVMYHGTSKTRWDDSISKHGLIPGKLGEDETYVDLIPGYSNKNIYLTMDPATAENYATRQAIKDGGRAIVLKVVVPDYSKFLPDEDAMENIKLSRNYRLSNQKYNQDVEIDETHLKWALLRINGGEYKETEEFFAFKEEIMKVLMATIKKSLKQGIVAYAGRIPPKFISPFMEYSKRSYGSENKLDFDNYQKIRKDVQTKAKRYEGVDAVKAIIREEIKKLI